MVVIGFLQHLTIILSANVHWCWRYVVGLLNIRPFFERAHLWVHGSIQDMARICKHKDATCRYIDLRTYLSLYTPKSTSFRYIFSMCIIITWMMNKPWDIQIQRMLACSISVHLKITLVGAATCTLGISIRNSNLNFRAIFDSAFSDLCACLPCITICKHACISMYTGVHIYMAYV
jgi:hypothetical protein